MKNIRVFSSENFQFLGVKFSIYLNRRVFVMPQITAVHIILLEQIAVINVGHRKVIVLYANSE